MDNKQIIVIGGGAAGSMAAGQAAAKGHQVLLLEKQRKIGRKIAISGKGRCNITNAGDVSDFIQYYPGNGKFLYAALKEFDNKDLIRFFEQYGVRTKVERGGRVFPEADDAEVIVRVLEKFLQHSGVEVLTEHTVEDIVVNDKKKVIGVLTNRSSDLIKADAVIVATGGASYPGTGSTGDGFVFAKRLGHLVVKPLPALVPLRTLESWPQELQGLTLKNVDASIWVDEKKKAVEFGELLFTHFGISGPIILTLSRIASQALENKRKVAIKINLKPALTEEQLDQRIQRDFQKYLNKHFKNALDDLLPKRMIPVMISLAGIDPEKPVHHISKVERKKLCRIIQELPLQVERTLGIQTAIVTAGGVDVKQINPTTMSSRIIGGLFWAGEVIDIDGVTGGYNLQAAFSSGYKAGRAAADYVSHRE